MTQISDLQDPQLGLSPEIFNAYIGINVTTLHRWQKDLLSKPLVLNSSKNVVYSAPTSSGKSLVYELIVLQRMQETHLKAIIILPFISITRQVHQRFQELNLPLRIVSFYGNEPTILFDECDIAVCTIEKANSIVNKLIDDQKLNLISTVVVDELHLIGDVNRGYILELLITKLLLSSPDVKIVGMSATIPEISVLASWLGAYSFETDFRPVRLVEYVKLENMIMDKLGNVVETLDVDMKAASKLGDPDLLIPVVFQTFRDMNSVLIFCAKRIDCEKTAKHIARLLDNPIDSLLVEGIMNSRQALIESLVDTETGLDPTLKYCILRGIAYHHSGLTYFERDLIEDAFRTNVILILCATSTLASGVNLPAKRVIFRTPYIGRNFITSEHYHQMKGRAGRFGQGLIGESIIMCKNTQEFKRVRELIMEIPLKLTSCLATSEKAMSQVVLEAIANRMADSEDSLKLYLQFTFYGHQSITNNGSVIESALTALKFLLENEFLVKNNESISPTSLGSATLISSLKPEEALFVYHELFRAMKNLVLINELHLIYLVTAPNTGQLIPNWAIFFELAQSFQSDVQLVADAVGINLAYISQLSRGFDQSQKSNRWQIHARFFQALIIYELVKEKSFSSISMKYDINRGTLQTIQNQSATFCGMVRTFAIQMKWEHYNQLFSLIQDRVTFGVEQELLQLSKIAGMNRLRARAFYEKGLRKPSDIANVQVSLIFEILAEVMKDSTKLNILKEARKISQEAKDFAF